MSICERLLITSGNGPAECRMAVRHVLEKMQQEAENANLDMDVTVPETTDKYGPTSAIVIIDGSDRDLFVRRWVGSVQWIATSPVRPKHRRRNWFVGIFRLDAQSVQSTALNRTDVRLEAFRAGGPGGQHQNKTDSAIRATHVPTGLTVVSRTQRSQHRNKDVALVRLADKLQLMNELALSQGRGAENQMHRQLERGNPVRVFKGERFREV